MRARRKQNRRRGRSILDGLRIVARVVSGCALVTLAVLAAMVTVRWVYDHEYFQLRAVDIVGTNEADLVRRWSGLQPGMSVWGVDVGMVTERLRRHGRLREILVMREFPDRVRIEIAERRPAALIRPAEPLFVGRDGVVFRPFPGEATIGLPWVSGVLFEDLELRPAWANECLRRAATVIGRWERYPAWPRISEVRPEEGGEVVVFPERIRLAVRFGEEISADAFGRLEKVFSEWRGSEANVAAIDLTVPGQAVLRMRKMKSAPLRRQQI